jgi:hypothetical protein
MYDNTENTIYLQIADLNDQNYVIELDLQLKDHVDLEQNREEKLALSIRNKDCFIVKSDKQNIGFVLFDYRFFGKGWIELILI